MRTLRGPRYSALRWSVLYASAVAGDDITVGLGVRVTMDVTQTPIYGLVTMLGTVDADPSKNTEIRAKRIEVDGGTWNIGSELTPFPADKVAAITVSGAHADESAGNLTTPRTATTSSNRGVMVMNGGKLNWVGAVPAISIVKLAATAAVGATSLTLASPVTWKAGWQLELSTTKYMAEGIGRERVTIAADVNNSTTVTLTAPLLYTHYGRLQYLVAPAHEDIAGTQLSVTQTTILDGDSFNGGITGAQVKALIAAGTPSVLDNRCTVGLLTYPIKFSAPNDSDWTTYGFGAQLMVMSLAAECRMQGVEMFRVGQAGFLGRYPVHHHMRSYTPYGSVGSGTLLGDVNSSANYLKQCSVRDSTNRGLTIHGTNGLTAQKNVFSNIDTHCIFFEDASERRNTVDSNFVSGVNAINTVISSGAVPIKQFDRVFDPTGEIPLPGRLNPTATTPGVASLQTNHGGPAGIWLSSPNNTITNNIVIGAYIGYWNAFSFNLPTSGGTYGFGCTGLSREVDYNPFFDIPLSFDNNEAGCVWAKCMSTLPSVVNPESYAGGVTDREAGNLAHASGPGGYFYRSGVPFGYPYQYDVHPTFTRNNFWKTMYGWYGNEIFGPFYDQWTEAGHAGIAETFAGGCYGNFGNSGSSNDGFTRAWMIANTLDDAYPDAVCKATLNLSYGMGITWQGCIFMPATIKQLHSDTTYLDIDSYGGVMNMQDFYVEAVIQRTGKLTNNLILGASGVAGVPCYRGVPHYMSAAFDAAIGGTAYQDLFSGSGINPNSSPRTKSNAGAVLLPYNGGWFGHTNAWYWWVYDTPYLLYGVSNTSYAPNGSALTTAASGYHLNGKLVALADADFMGLYPHYIDDLAIDEGGFTDLQRRVIYKRYTDSTFTTAVTNGEWEVPAPGNSTLSNMRSGPMLSGGAYHVSWPNYGRISSFIGEFYGAYSPFSVNKHVWLRFDYAPTVALTNNPRVNNDVDFESYSGEVFTLAEVTGCSSTAKVFYRDTANHHLYLHFYTGYIPSGSPGTNLLSATEAQADGRCNVWINHP